MRNLKRVLSLALALVMVIGMMVMGAGAASADFGDAAEIDYTEAVDVLTGLGVLEGDENGDFNAKDILTREQAAKIIAYICLGEKNAKKLTANQDVFTDVAADRWSAGYISYCVNIGILAGYGNGTFGPKDQLTGVQFAKMLLTTAGYDAAAQGYVGLDWATEIGTDAIKAGLDVDGVLLGAPVTREVAAQMVLQALEMNVVEYTTMYDYATGADILVGPNAVTTKEKGKTVEVLFMNKYFEDLKKTTGGHEEVWGRPIDHEWVYGKKTICTVMVEPDAVYTEAVSECDIAKDLGLKKDAEVVYVADNGDTGLNIADYFGTDKDVTLNASKAKVGAQGRLVEIYDLKDGIEVVIIDTYLAIVTDVEEAEFDKNGHLEIEAELDLDVYGDQGAVDFTLYADEDWEYEVGDVLLVNVSAYDEYTVEIVDYADSLVGAQTAYTTKANTHIVEDEDYTDAVNFYLDEAVDETTNHTWYFDQYGNLIGAMDISTTSSYATITSIYWRDSNDGENGYAKATITYIDGTQESVKIAKIDNVTLEGIEGKNPEYAKGEVSSTKQYNADAYTNVALYSIKEGKKGLELTTVDVENKATIETGVPALTANLNAGKSTKFLIWNGEDYETYTGIKNVPTYEGKYDIYYVDAKDDDVADIIFVIEPTDAASTQAATYFWNSNLTVKTYLKNSAKEYFTLTGGYVNGEKEVISTKSEDIKNALISNACKDTLLFLTITDGYVTGYEVVDNTEAGNEIGKTKTYAVYAGAVADASLTDDVLVSGYGDAYDVENAELISDYSYSLTQTFKKVEDGRIADDAAYLYIIYTNGKSNVKNASLVYVVKTEGTEDNSIDAGVVEVNWVATASALMKVTDASKWTEEVWALAGEALEALKAGNDAEKLLAAQLETHMATITEARADAAVADAKAAAKKALNDFVGVYAGNYADTAKANSAVKALIAAIEELIDDATSIPEAKAIFNYDADRDEKYAGLSYNTAEPVIDSYTSGNLKQDVMTAIDNATKSDKDADAAVKANQAKADARAAEISGKTLSITVADTTEKTVKDAMHAALRKAMSDKTAQTYAEFTITCGDWENFDAGMKTIEASVVAEYGAARSAAVKVTFNVSVSAAAASQA